LHEYGTIEYWINIPVLELKKWSIVIREVVEEIKESEEGRE